MPVTIPSQKRYAALIHSPIALTSVLLLGLRECLGRGKLGLLRGPLGRRLEYLSEGVRVLLGLVPHGLPNNITSYHTYNTTPYLLS